MKRLLLLSSALLLLVSINASAQTKKVLVEEYTSSTCPPCAITDPIMLSFEKDYADKIVVVKYHQDYPSPGNDPMYASFKNGRARADNYGVQGIPDVYFNGGDATYPGRGDSTLKAKVDNALAAMSTDYTITIQQARTSSMNGPDSLIATVTVKAGSTVATNVNLGVVVTEGYVVYKGRNGRAFHTSVARTFLPALPATGALGSNSKLTLGANQSKTFRFATPIRSDWNPNQLYITAFLQDPVSKEVFAAENNIAPILLEPNGSIGVIVGDASHNGSWKLKNTGVTEQQVRISSSVVAPYSLIVRHNEVIITPQDPITLAAGASTTITVEGTSSGAYSTNPLYHLLVSGNEIGAGGDSSYAWGKDLTTAYIDAGVGYYQGSYQGAPRYSIALGTAGLKVGKCPFQTFSTAFNEWSAFKNIIWDAAYAPGIETTSGDTARVRNFVAGGGNFVLSSLTMVTFYYNAGLSRYLEEVFHIDPSFLFSPVTNWTDLNGVSGDPIGDGITSVVSNMVYSQPIAPLTDDPSAEAASAFYNENGDTVGVHAKYGAGKTVFLTFEPGNIVSNTAQNAMVKNLVNFLNGPAGVNESKPLGISMEQNFPNPIVQSASISYNLSDRSNIRLVVRDLLGRDVVTLVSGVENAGPHIVTLDTKNIPNGTYLYSLTANGEKIEKKLVVAK